MLAESFLEHNPGSTFSVLIIDPPALAAGETYEIVEPDDLGLDPVEYLRMAAIYDVMELATAVKPWLLRLLLERGEPVVYLDPDIEVFRQLDEAAELAEQYGIVLTPHLTDTVPPDAEALIHKAVLYSGIYNLGFIAVSEDALPFLKWWEKRLSRDCLVAPAQARFVDQRWVDLVPGLFSSHIVDNPSWNVAWWNLDRRRLARAGGGYEVNGRPLAFFHYSGYDPRRPHLVSKFLGDSPPVILSEEPLLADFLDRYRSKLLAADFDAFTQQPYRFDSFGHGIPLDRRMRRLYRSALLESEEDGTPEPPNPFAADNGRGFVEWLREADDSVGGASSISRYLQKVRLEDPNLTERFHDVRWLSDENYLDWVRTEGWGEHRIPRELRPRVLPRESRPEIRLEPGINVTGYLRAELGIGEAARLLLRGVESAEIPHATFAYEKTQSRQRHEFEPSLDALPPYDTNLICVNADQLRAFTFDVGPAFFRNRYSIGMWFWELSSFPQQLHEAFEVVQEVWVASDFIRDALAAEADMPVLKVPLPVETRDDPGEPPAFVPRNRFLFLFSFDFLSVFDRKNPLGAVEAFARAFAPDEGPVLLLKSINGEHALRELEALRYAARDRTDIVVVDEYVSAREKDALTACCDCYVSLHKSEGFGLTLAEAMSYGKPVIATAYSGNLEFMDDENSYLVPYELGRTTKTSKPYASGLEWAEPNLEEASRLMRHVYEHQAEARERGAIGQMRIRKEHSPERTGDFINQQLAEIEARRPQGEEEHGEDVKGPLGALGAAERYVETGPEGTLKGVGPHGRAGSAARKVLFRLLRPYTTRHREFERSVLSAITALDAKVDALREETVDAESELLERLERTDRRLEAFEAVTDRTLARIAAIQRGAADVTNPVKRG